MAILKHQCETLTSQLDTIGVMRYLKSCTAVLFDADGLLKVLGIQTPTVMCGRQTNRHTDHATWTFFALKALTCLVDR